MILMDKVALKDQKALGCWAVGCFALAVGVVVVVVVVVWIRERFFETFSNGCFLASFPQQK